MIHALFVIWSLCSLGFILSFYLSLWPFHWYR